MYPDVFLDVLAFWCSKCCASVHCGSNISEQFKVTADGNTDIDTVSFATGWASNLKSLIQTLFQSPVKPSK